MENLMKIPFFRLGVWLHPVYGKITITQETFDQIIDNFNKNVLGREPHIRLGHDKNGKSTFGDVAAEGWVKAIEQEGDVLNATAEPTSEEAAKNIRSKRYRFASAEYTRNGIDKESGKPVGALLSAIALTNEPFLTKLPEATLLADQPEMFYLDFSEAINNESEGAKLEELLKQIMDALKGILSGQKAESEELKKQQETTQTQLAEMNKALQTQLQLAEQGKQLAEQAQLLAEVDTKATDMVAQGIPPIMVNQWKALATSEAGQNMLKLSDGQGRIKEVSQAEAMRDMLLALPEAHRIPFEQRGTQASGNDVEKIKLACDEDIKMLGGVVTADGKYKI